MKNGVRDGGTKLSRRKEGRKERILFSIYTFFFNSFHILMLIPR